MRIQGKNSKERERCVFFRSAFRYTTSRYSGWCFLLNTRLISLSVESRSSLEIPRSSITRGLSRMTEWEKKIAATELVRGVNLNSAAGLQAHVYERARELSKKAKSPASWYYETN